MITITHEGGNCKAVLANGSIQYWVTRNVLYSSDGDNVTVTRDGVEVFTADIADITIDGEPAYGTAADVIEQIQATDVQSKILEQVSGDLGGGSSSYLVYTALLTQSGTDAPVATVLENTLGGAVALNYDGVGGYYLSSALFAENKTAAFATPNGAFNGNIAMVAVEPLFNEGGYPNEIVYLATRDAAGATRDDWGTVIAVEIRVYP
jgi:hypothetical protein